jgi:GR25 family glycosyltransferase involved in LPS biosynthesis
MRFLSRRTKQAEVNDPPAPVLTLKNSSGNYCISLISQPERLEQTVRQLAFYGIHVEHFPAVLSTAVVRKITREDGVNKIADGCLQSHLDLYQKILANHKSDKTHSRPYVAVFEDDIVALSTLNQLDDYVEKLPEDWDLVYLGGNYHFHKPILLDDYLIRPACAFNTHAQLIRIDFLPRLIQELEKKKFEVDVVYGKLHEAGIGQWYGFTTDFFWQHARTSATCVSLWQHQLGEFHFSKANQVIDQVIIKNHLP